MLLSDAPAGSRPCAILTASARPSAYPIHKTARSSCPCSKNRSASSVYLVAPSRIALQIFCIACIVASDFEGATIDLLMIGTYFLIILPFYV